jgi:hypothetical protein
MNIQYNTSLHYNHYNFLYIEDFAFWSIQSYMGEKN